ncbi:MAG: hypothetical protein ACRDD5_20720 [Silvania sp.]|uniref:hypothetical protein n=1 Tax=Silvania sp. TaxID=3016633 RepID=UPI003EE48F6E
MFYSDEIISKLQAENILALKIEEALAGVKNQTLETGRQIRNGATRLSYYASCFTDNYQDVCSKLKEEDIRFLDGIFQLVKDRNLIYTMISIYIDMLLAGKSDESIRNIQRLLLRSGVAISSSFLTGYAFALSVTAAICIHVKVSSHVQSRIGQVANLAMLPLKAYGLVQQASVSADNLKISNPVYYHALYIRKLEMMYFLVEPLFSNSRYVNPFTASDSEIADSIARMMK